MPILQEILDTYQKASGAHMNIDKSRSVAIGEWDATRRIMNISYYGEITILGFTFKSKSNVTNKEQWHRISQVRAIAQDAYYRKLDLYMRIRYVYDYLLAKIWHTAQILPITVERVRQLNCTIAWHIWRGEIFRVPLSALQRSESEGAVTSLKYGQRVELYSYYTYGHKDSVKELPQLTGLRSGTSRPESKTPLFWTSPGSVGIHTRIHKRRSV